MRTSRKFLLVLAMLAIPGTAGSSPAQGSAPPREETGLLLRVEGDAVLDRGDTAGAVVVVNGSAVARGAAGSVLVVGGTALLDGARVGDLTVVGGTARLENGATVTGNVNLVGSELQRMPGTTVQGQVVRSTPSQLTSSVWLFGLVAAVGVWIAILVGGVAAAAVAGGLMRDAGDTLVREPGGTVLAAAVLWIGVPVLAMGVMSTVVGIPLGLGILVFVLPVLGLLGYLAAGIRVGTVVLRRTGDRAEPVRPYREALVGIAILLVLGMVPGLGALTTLLAATVGAGALVLSAWRREQERRRPGRRQLEVPVQVVRPEGTPARAGVGGEDG